MKFEKFHAPLVTLTKLTHCANYTISMLRTFPIHDEIFTQSGGLLCEGNMLHTLDSADAKNRRG